MNDRVRITKYKNIFSKGYTENWSREVFIVDSVLKTNTWSYKIKDILDINKLTNVPTSLNNLKTKIDDVDVGKLKTVSVDLKKLSDIVDNEVVKNTKFNTLKAKVNNLD